jgi:asparagine N-glycosylation enzyme membrane subunit Stt3
MFFLKIGNHKDLYTQTLVENLIYEFPEIINDLGIYAMPDMPVGKKYEYSYDEMKDTWTSGGNVSFYINNQYYTSANAQTFSRLNTEVIYITQKIIYQFEESLRQFNLQLNEDSELNKAIEIVPLKYDDDEFFKGGNILIGDKISKTATEIPIDFLKKLKHIDVMLKKIT